MVIPGGAMMPITRVAVGGPRFTMLLLIHWDDGCVDIINFG
jgi:hypothetical protein